MATNVLVGGAWLGAWAWADVAGRLRSLGHDVRPISLSGLGERESEGTPDTNLETHIADIVSVLERDDLRDVILVGHSYAGVPITGAGDRAADRHAELDGGEPADDVVQLRRPGQPDFVERPGGGGDRVRP